MAKRGVGFRADKRATNKQHRQTEEEKKRSAQQEEIKEKKGSECGVTKQRLVMRMGEEKGSRWRGDEGRKLEDGGWRVS